MDGLSPGPRVVVAPLLAGVVRMAALAAEVETQVGDLVRRLPAG